MASTSSLPMYVRGPTRTDAGFLLDSWLRSYQHSWSVKRIEPSLYYRHQQEITEDLLTRSTVLVGCDAESPDVIWGWVCAEVIGDALVIHYCYTKEVFRGRKVASALIKMILDAEKAQGWSPNALVWTHDTKSADHFIAGLRGNGTIDPSLPAMFNPYVLKEDYSGNDE